MELISFILVRDVMHLVLQAKPDSVKSDEIETTVLASVERIIIRRRTQKFHRDFRFRV